MDEALLLGAATIADGAFAYGAVAIIVLMVVWNARTGTRPPRF